MNLHYLKTITFISLIFSNQAYGDYPFLSATNTRGLENRISEIRKLLLSPIRTTYMPMPENFSEFDPNEKKEDKSENRKAIDLSLDEYARYLLGRTSLDLKYTKDIKEIGEEEIAEIVENMAYLIKNINKEIDEEHFYKTMILSIQKRGVAKGLVEPLLNIIDKSIMFKQGYIASLINPLLQKINPELANLYHKSFDLIKAEELPSSFNFKNNVDRIFVKIGYGEYLHEKALYSDFRNDIKEFFKSPTIDKLDLHLQNGPFADVIKSKNIRGC